MVARINLGTVKAAIKQYQTNDVLNRRAVIFYYIAMQIISLNTIYWDGKYC